jgi:hypothetical protein
LIMYRLMRVAAACLAHATPNHAKLAGERDNSRNSLVWAALPVAVACMMILSARLRLARKPAAER